MSVKVDEHARSLMELANQEGLVELLFSEIKRINDELNRNAELSRYIDSSDYSAEEKKARLQDVFDHDLDDSVLYALFQVIGRIPQKHVERALIRSFLSYYYQLRGYVFGTAYSANELDAGELVNLEAAFSYKLKQAIRLENKIDKSLIGGVKVEISDEVWDGSYKARMKDLRSALLEAGHGDLENISADLKKHIEAYDRETIRNETTYTAGTVSSVADGVANISGIYNAMAGELLDIGNTKAMVMDLEEHNIAAVLLGSDNDIIKGTQVYSTGKVVEVPVGDVLLGRVVDALGRPIDGKGPIVAEEHRQIEANAPGVIERQPVNEPLQTGLKVIDSMIPIGKGQRELIIGDRQTGKTAIAIDTIINQKGRNVKCIYVAIGQKNSTVAQIIEKLNQYQAMEYTTVVVAGASELASLN